MPVCLSDDGKAGAHMAKEGEVTYEIRSDDSNLDSDLAKAEKKVEEHAKKTSDKTIKTEKETASSIKKEQSEVTEHHKKEKGQQEKTEQKSAKTFKGLAKEISADVKKKASDIKENATKAITAIRHPIKSVTAFSSEKASDIKKHFKDSFNKTKENAVSGMERVAKAMLHPVDTAKSAAKSIKESFSGAIESMKPALAGIGKAGAGVLGAGFMAAGTAVGAVGTIAAKSAVNMDKAMNSFAAAAGTGAEATEKYKQVLEEVYKNNYGESFEDIASAMTQIRQQIGPVVDTWDSKGIQEFTESAFALRDTFGYDIQESVRAANAMMEHFGIDGEKAMSMIAAGTQKGLDFSGELIDSISEYSVQFAKVGLDADDMFKIFQSGADSGAFNLDKIGDAIKEMSIRVIDGSDTTAEGFALIGLNADEMSGKFAQGGESAKEAFQEMVAALAAMEDPLAQNTAGTNLFGTMWEDLGPNVVTQLAAIKDGAYDTEDALNTIKEVKYDDLGSMFEGLKRSTEMLLIPLGEELIPVLSELIEAVMPIVEEVLPPLTEAIGEVIGALSPLMEEILPVLTDMVGELLPPFMEIISNILPVLTELVSMLVPPLMEIISEVMPVLCELINALLPIISTLITLLQPVIDLFMKLLDPILTLISQALVPLINSLAPLISMLTESLIPVLNFLGEVFEQVFAGILASVSGVMGNMTNIFKEILSFIKNVFTGNWKGAWENIRNIFKNIVEGLATFLKIPINAMIDLINGFIKGINKIKIPDWVPAVGGKGFTIPEIPKLRMGMDFVPEDDFPAFLHRGEAVLTAQENALYQANGGISGVIRSLEGPQAVNKAEIDYERLGRAIADSMPEQKLIIAKGAIEGEVTIDGKYAGRVLAPVIDQILGEIQKRKERG